MRIDRGELVKGLRRGAVLLGLMAWLPAAGCGEELTAFNYERVERGMTLKEVEGLLGRGEPHAGAPIAAAKADPGISAEALARQAFVWRSAEREVIVRFRAGKVVSKHKDGF